VARTCAHRLGRDSICGAAIWWPSRARASHAPLPRSRSFSSASSPPATGRLPRRLPRAQWCGQPARCRPALHAIRIALLTCYSPYRPPTASQTPSRWGGAGVLGNRGIWQLCAHDRTAIWRGATADNARFHSASASVSLLQKCCPRVPQRTGHVHSCTCALLTI
jgi:hypothetical protein